MTVSGPRVRMIAPTGARSSSWPRLEGSPPCALAPDSALSSGWSGGPSVSVTKLVLVRGRSELLLLLYVPGASRSGIDAPSRDDGPAGGQSQAAVAVASASSFPSKPA